MPAACDVTVTSARPSASALTARCGAAAALDDAASEICAPLTVWTITWVGMPRFGVGFETVALQVIGGLAAAVAVGETVGVGAATSDDGVGPPADAADWPDDEALTELADPGATAAVLDGGRLAQAAVTASAISAQPVPAARASAPDRDLGAASIAADATPEGRYEPTPRPVANRIQ